MKIFIKLYDWRILVPVLVLLIILVNTPFGFLPDYFNLKKSITAGTFTRITISFISVFSFLVTVLILGYGFLREKFRRLALSNYHYHFSENKIPLLYLEEVSFFINTLVERLVAENVNDVTEDALMTFERIIEYHYDNSAPKQEQLKELVYFFEKTDENYKRSYTKLSSTEDNINLNLQWSKIYSDIPYVFSIALRKSIEKKNSVIVDGALNSVRLLVHSVYNSKMGEYQKAWIVRMLAGQYHVHLLEAIKSGVSKEYIEGIDGFVLTQMIDENSVSKKFIFISTAEFMADLLRLKKLNLASFNFIGAVGRHCTNNYTLQGAKESFEYILKMIRYFKMEFEKSLGDNILNYKTLKEEVESFKDFHEMKSFKDTKIGERDAKNISINTSLIETLNSLLKEFKEIPEAKPGISLAWD